MHDGRESSIPDNEHASSHSTVTKAIKPELNGVGKEMDGQQHIDAQDRSHRYEAIVPSPKSARPSSQNGAPPNVAMSPPRIVTTVPRDTPPVSPHIRALSDVHDPMTSGVADIPGAGRRSVQFTRDTVNNEQGDSNTEALDERSPAQNGSTLYSRIKAFAVSPSFIHSRASSGDANTRDSIVSPRSERNEAYFPMTLEEDGSEVDADAEESGAEREPGTPSTRKRRRKNHVLHEGGIKTAPATPGTPLRPALLSSHSLASADGPRPTPPLRRATTNDIPEDHHAVSEDEGRNRLNAGSPSRMRNALRGISYGQGQKRNNHGTLEGKRPTTMKRLTGLVGHSDGGDSPSRRHRMKGERGTSLSAQKWRQIKQQLKLLGPKKGKDRTIDHEKSAELLAELIAGSPAALMLASMFQRDEHGSKRVPVLLEQLKVKIVDSEYDSRSRESDAAAQSDRHMVFRIELEYGNGLNRMKWTIRRSLRDFANLHLKYKLHFSTQKYVRLKAPDDKGMPRFPKSAFPYLKQVRGLEDEIEDDDDEAGNDAEGVVAGREDQPRNTPGDPPLL